MAKLSVIISTHNRAADLRNCLTALSEQASNNDLNFEVIVVDNNSSDQTKELARSYSSVDVRFKYFFEPEHGKSFALNRGLRESSGEIIAITDDDCIPEKDWLQKIYRYFQNDSELDLILGGAKFANKEPFFLSKDIFRGNGLNLSFKKRLIDDVGNFDTYLGPGSIGFSAEDTNFVYRCMLKGKRIAVVDDIEVIHKERESLQHCYKVTYRDCKSLMIFWLKYILQRRDSYALKNIYWFFSYSFKSLLREIKLGNRERILLKIYQIKGALLGLIKGLFIWLIIEPTRKLCQESA